MRAYTKADSLVSVCVGGGWSGVNKGQRLCGSVWEGVVRECVGV